MQGCMKKYITKRKYTMSIESVLTAHNESCTAYLLIGEVTDPIGTMQKI